jgi:hypothetical protein
MGVIIIAFVVGVSIAFVGTKSGITPNLRADDVMLSIMYGAFLYLPALLVIVVTGRLVGFVSGSDEQLPIPVDDAAVFAWPLGIVFALFGMWLARRNGDQQR